MDNLPHTVIGILVTETVHRSLPPSAALSGRPGGPAITMMAIGGNPADADVLEEYVTAPKQHSPRISGATKKATREQARATTANHVAIRAPAIRLDQMHCHRQIRAAAVLVGP